MTDNAQHLDFDDQLESVTVDILSETRHTPVLTRLFSQPSGIWVRLVDLGAILDDTHRALYPDVSPEVFEDFWVCWLADPPPVGGHFRTVVFFHPLSSIGPVQAAHYNVSVLAPRLIRPM